tara:strand:- start:460 stop:1242 length:783 start_codon:yes stop_codon:yes gene_type:complete
MFIDIVSDLHVEYWIHRPYTWKPSNKADVVVIAGDIADDLDLTINELNKACDVYEKVIYIDGNHESSKHYNDLSYANKYICEHMKPRCNFFNLSETEIVLDNYVIIGACGWWDFKICEPDITFEESVNNFNCDWNTRLDINKESIVNNIINEANINYINIKNKIKKYKDHYKICLVTHTVPSTLLLSDNYPYDKRYAASYGNSMFAEFVKEDAVKYFIFGHNHDAIQKKLIGGKTFINNARGRPQDFNRISYKAYTTELI